MPRPSLGLTKVNFYLDPAVLQGYKWLAAARGTTYSELLRVAARDFVLKEIKKEQGDIQTLAVTEPEAANA